MLENNKIAKLHSERNELWSPTEWTAVFARRRASPWGSRWTPWFCRRQPSGHRWLRATGTRFAAPGRCRCCNQFIHSFIYTCSSCSLLVIDEHAEFVSSLAVIATLLVEFPEQVLESLPSAAVDLVLQELLDVRRFALKMLKWIDSRRVRWFIWIWRRIFQEGKTLKFSIFPKIGPLKVEARPRASTRSFTVYTK